MIPEYDRLAAKFEVRMGPALREKIEFMARFARARSISDYVRSGIEDFLGREQKRLGLSDQQISTGVEMLRQQRAARKVRPILHRRKEKLP